MNKSVIFLKDGVAIGSRPIADQHSGSDLLDTIESDIEFDQIGYYYYDSKTEKMMPKKAFKAVLSKGIIEDDGVDQAIISVFIDRPIHVCISYMAHESSPLHPKTKTMTPVNGRIDFKVKSLMPGKIGVRLYDVDLLEQSFTIEVI